MSEGPKRIQRRRTRGWRMPAGSVYVGRPTKWGNRFKVGDIWDQSLVWHLPSWGEANTRDGETVLSPQLAVELFRQHVYSSRDAALELRGKDLVCWCPLDQPCHADALLEWANAEGQR